MFSISIYYFTEKGKRLADVIGSMNISDFRKEKIQFNIVKGCNMNEQLFKEKDAHIFIGALGIAVRKIAPFIDSKLTDPAVIVIDELGTNVIPVLSGHIGGANELSTLLADQLKANAVITTATDINGRKAIDLVAVNNGLVIKDSTYIKNVNKKILSGETVKVYCDDSVNLRVNNKSEDRQIRNDSVNLRVQNDYDFVMSDKDSADVIISADLNSADLKDAKSGALHLFNPNIIIGIGCRKNTDSKLFESTLCEALSQADLLPDNVSTISSIDLKAEEKAIIDFCKKYGIRFVTHTAEELNSLSGDFDESEFVKNITGVSNVSERAAVFEAGSNGTFLHKRISENGITISIMEVKRDIFI